MHRCIYKKINWNPTNPIHCHQKFINFFGIFAKHFIIKIYKIKSVESIRNWGGLTMKFSFSSISLY
jgi:hypothetical protein